MPVREAVDNWWNRSLYDEPRQGLFSWILLGLAVAYSVVVPLYYPYTVVFVPFVLLFTVAEVLPTDRTRIAVAFRVVGLVYMVLTPVIFYTLGF